MPRGSFLPLVPALVPALVLLAALTPGVAAAQTTTPAATAHAPARVVGYVMDRESLPAISADKLDTVIHAFALVDPTHTVHLPQPGMAARLDQLVALRQVNPRLQVLLAIGGWGADHFSEAAATAQARRQFARSAVALVARHDLDGLDIDWEYPTLPGPGISHAPEDRDHVPLLLQAVREALQTLTAQTGRRYQLTLAAADGEAARGLDLPRIVPWVDAIHLMTYDFHGSLEGGTGHHAGLRRSASAPDGTRDSVQAVDAFLAAGAPADKLLLGMAFYGKRFHDVGAGNHGLHQPFEGTVDTLSWREIRRDVLTDPAFVRHWDARAQAPWLWNATTRTLISYEDPDAIAAKAAYARTRGLAGVMYWQHDQDDDEQLLDSARRGLGLP
jgi:chitinase